MFPPASNSLPPTNARITYSDEQSDESDGEYQQFEQSDESYGPPPSGPLPELPELSESPPLLSEDESEPLSTEDQSESGSEFIEDNYVTQGYNVQLPEITPIKGEDCNNTNIFTLENYETTDDLLMFYLYNADIKKFGPANCLYKREELRDSLISNLSMKFNDIDETGYPIMSLWTTPTNSRLSRQAKSMGYGGKPNYKYVVKLPLNNILVTYNSAYRILDENTRKWYLVPLYDGKPKRIGSLTGHFTVSGNHGQVPGFIVYTAKTYEELQENNIIDDSSIDYQLQASAGTGIVNKILKRNLDKYFVEKISKYDPLRILLGKTPSMTSQLKKLNAYISGSSMITMDNTDMDIYIPKKSYSGFVYFMDKYNYFLDDVNSIDSTKTYEIIETRELHKPELLFSRTNIKYDAKNIFKVVSFKHKTGNKIDVILCNEHPLYTISHFDLTCNINWFNGETIYYYHNFPTDMGCFYNTTNNYTDAQRKTTVTRKEKYKKRGYSITDKKLDTEKIFMDMLVYDVLKGKNFTRNIDY